MSDTENAIVSPESFKVLRDIAEERKRQDVKWGRQDHPYEVWRPILGEEIGEADQEWLKMHFGHRVRGQELREELVQVAAVVAAMIECGDRNRWFES